MRSEKTCRRDPCYLRMRKLSSLCTRCRDLFRRGLYEGAIITAEQKPRREWKTLLRAVSRVKA